MSGQLIAMRVRVRSVFGGECGLFNGFMFGMRERMDERVVPGIFQVLLPVLARSPFDRGFRLAVCLLFLMSW